MTITTPPLMSGVFVILCFYPKNLLIMFCGSRNGVRTHAIRPLPRPAQLRAIQVGRAAANKARAKAQILATPKRSKAPE